MIVGIVGVVDLEKEFNWCLMMEKVYCGCIFDYDNNKLVVFVVCLVINWLNELFDVLVLLFYGSEDKWVNLE